MQLNVSRSIRSDHIGQVLLPFDSPQLNRNQDTPGYTRIDPPHLVVLFAMLKRLSLLHHPSHLDAVSASYHTIQIW